MNKAQFEALLEQVESSGAKLVAVSKSVDINDVKGLASFGQLDFGENRVQELERKIQGLAGIGADYSRLRWHFIGRLQSNKINALLALRPALWQSCESVMQAELEAVKPGDFADATTDEVMPGVTVVIVAKDGEKTWTILGEWDNDLEKGILSSKTRVAQNLLGKKVGDDFELPDADGNLTFATVKEIKPLSDDIREWMKLPAGVQI